MVSNLPHTIFFKIFSHFNFCVGKVCTFVFDVLMKFIANDIEQKSYK